MAASARPAATRARPGDTKREEAPKRPDAAVMARPSRVMRRLKSRTIFYTRGPEFTRGGLADVSGIYCSQRRRLGWTRLARHSGNREAGRRVSDRPERMEQRSWPAFQGSRAHDPAGDPAAGRSGERVARASGPQGHARPPGSNLWGLRPSTVG